MVNLKLYVKIGGILLGVIGIIILIIGLIDIIKSHPVITSTIAILEIIGAGIYFYADKYLEN